MSEPDDWYAEPDPPPAEVEGFMVPPLLMEQIREHERLNGPPEYLATKMSGTFAISQELLDDYAGNEVSDWLRKALRGEIEPQPPRKPQWHRCLACWLVSLLPGHGRCEHGRLRCEDCESDR